MRVKQTFNEIYIGFIHLQLQFIVPILWMVYMDEGSSITRFIFPLTLFAAAMLLSKKIAGFIAKEKKETL